MQINNLSNFDQKASKITVLDNLEQLKNNPSSTQIESTSKQPGNQFDVHHMSPNELENLITELRESGQISEMDSMMLTIDCYDLIHFGGVAKDTKIDMTAFFEEQIDIQKSTPETKGVELLERSLNILKAVEARNQANIPQSV